MKPLIVIAAACGLATAAHAEEGKPGHPHHKLRPEIVEKFDKDKDGKLDEAEREAAKAARRERMKAHHEKMLKRFDKDGDGKLNDEEETAMKAERRQKMLERFDKDKDGKLSDGEKAEMRKAMKNHRPGGPHDGERKHHPRDGKGNGKPAPDGEAPGVTG